MLSVSADFLTAAKDVVRFVKAKVELLWTDPYVLSGNTVTADDGNYHSWHDPHLADTIVTTPHKYLVLDGNCSTDSNYYVAPSTATEAANNQFGWYTADVSGETTTPAPTSTTTTPAPGYAGFPTSPTATVTFNDPRPIKQIVVVGEPTLGEYPTEFDIEIYDSGDSLLNSGNTNFTGTSVTTEIDFTDENISTAKYMKLILKSWSVVGTVGKIVEFFGTVADTFYTDDIVSMDLTEEREVKKATLPIGNISSNELDLELQNIQITRVTGETYKDPFFPDNSDSYLQAVITPNVRVKAYLGFQLPDTSIEYAEIGTFWTNDWVVDEDNFSVSVTARDRIEIMRNVEFLANEVLENYTLYDIAEYILEYAKVNIPMNDLEYSISAELNNYTIPYCWFGKTNYADCLAKIAEACLGQVYMSKSDVLTIESFHANEGGISDLTIIRDEYFKRRQPINNSDLKNRVEVSISPLLPEDTESEIITSEEKSFDAGETDQTVEILWDSDEAVLEPDAIIIDESGITVTITDETFYPWGCYIDCHKASGTSGTFKIKITGKKLVNVDYDPETLDDEESQTVYGKKELKYKENFLIQSSSLATTIARALLDSAKDPRRDVILEWIGNPALELGDTITAPVYVDNSDPAGSTITDDFIVYKQSYKYDGGLRCSTYARKLIEYTTTTTTTTEAPTTTSTTSGA